MKQLRHWFLPLLLALCLTLSACESLPAGTVSQQGSATATVAALEDLPAYSGQPYVELDDNVPDFSDLPQDGASFEEYSPLDDLGRCGPATACVGLDTMPTEERGSIGQVKPSGWQTVKYDCVDGKYLYNRCHLIGYQLTAENANKENLITGTRYLNVEGMLPFENMVADYVKETENHVLYRVTPLFDGDDLVAHGVRMEAWSVEDQGEGVCFDVYCYNVQPGVTIDYATGESWLAEEAPAGESGNTSAPQEQEESYVLNTSSKKIHLPDCSGVTSMNPANRQDYTGTLQSLLDQGYEPCGICHPDQK